MVNEEVEVDVMLMLDFAHLNAVSRDVTITVTSHSYVFDTASGLNNPTASAFTPQEIKLTAYATAHGAGEWSRSPRC